MPVLSNPETSQLDEAAEPGPVPDATAAIRLDVEPTTNDDDTTRRARRRWPWVVAAVGVAGIAAAASVVALGGGDDVESEEPEIVTLAAVSAEVRDLIEFDELDGRMIYADVEPIASSTDGVITSLLDSGDAIERGTVLYAVNAAPTTAFYGTVPFYRSLDEESVGDDVLVLEKNLAALGYHSFEDEDGNMVDTDFVVDRVYDKSTTDAVVRWQEDAGIEESGIVAASDVIVLDGPAVVSSVTTDVGRRVNVSTPIMELNIVGTADTAHYEHSGEIETFVTSGQELASGDVLYSADGLAVTAMVSDATFDRDIEDGIDAGDDILAVEEMLVSLGYDTDGDLDVDDVFDEDTEQAIIEWEEDLQNTFDAVVVDGVVSLDEIIIFEPGTVAGSVVVYDEEIVASGSELWSSSTETTTRIVKTSIAVADQDKLAEANVVDIEFPDGDIVQGTVTTVATSTTTDPMSPDADPMSPDADPMIAVEISVIQVPASVRDLNEVDVQIKLVEEIAAGATVVPVSALVATGDGNFSVEAVTTTGTTFVQVGPGMFSDGWVEVTGIEPGTQVVVPS
ncbi:MAG: peptidoglycan-binding domain-containing protein [Acidimicrobiia bacterium]|nr:peptidoglycan-binding domain-containing protein [Acidimicrobiia bacterium]